MKICLYSRLATVTNIQGCECLGKFAEESKARNPELLCSAKLRKHVETLCQFLDLDNQELEQVPCFVGHDIRIHYNFYNFFADRTFQVTIIGKLLVAMGHGAKSLQGKSFKTLDSVVFGTYVGINDLVFFFFFFRFSLGLKKG